MEDSNSSGGFSLNNIRGTPLAVLLILIAAAIGLGIIGFSFKGSVVV
jgi:hypothetical protein